MEFHSLIDALAERLGIAEGVSPDAEGVFRLGAEGVSVAFLEVPENRSLVMFGEVCELPEEGADALKTALLKENFMGRGAPDGAFSLSKENRVVLHRYVDLEKTDADALLALVENFLRRVLDWRNLVAEYGPFAWERVQREREDRLEAERFHMNMV